MQTVNVTDIKVKEGITAEGARAGQKWQLVIITGDDGSEFTTFDIKAKEVGIGGVIELEPVIKNGKTNFTKFKIISKGSALAATASSSNGNRETSPEEWKEKQRIERASFEGQTAFKGVIELAIAYIAHDKDPRAIEEIKEPFGLALAWAQKRLSPSLPESLTNMPHLGRPENDSPPAGQFKNVGEFFTAMKEKGLTRTQTIDELIRLKLITSESDLPKLNLVEAWEALGDAIIPAA